MGEIQFSCKIDSLNLDSNVDHSQMVLTNVSFNLSDDSLAEVNRAITIQKNYLVTLQVMKAF